jgi:hypothetical protein
MTGSRINAIVFGRIYLSWYLVTLSLGLWGFAYIMRTKEKKERKGKRHFTFIEVTK